MNSIFEYKKFAACNFLGGNTDSFEIKISEDGCIEYHKTDFDGNNLEFNFYKLSDSGISKIKKCIQGNYEVFDINSMLNNGSYDGCGNEFWFANEKKNRRIVAWNIDDSIDDGHKIRKEYLKEYGANLLQERKVLKLFFEICNVLVKEKFELNLFEFKTNNKSMY